MMRDSEVNQSNDALKNVLESDGFQAAPQLQRFLKYVVDEELAGRGDQLKAYNIAVDALGRPESFDAQSDPVVRVQAGRLRKLLAAYYAGEGADEPVRIELPKGSYRPRFVEHSVAIGQSDYRRAMIAAIVILLAVVGVLAYMLADHIGDFHSDQTPPEQVVSGEPPIVEVQPFVNNAGEANRAVVEGLRLQLISDLSHFRSLRVRTVHVEEGQTALLRPARYRITGIAVITGGRIQFTLTALETKNRTLLWSKTFYAPGNDNQFYALLSDTVRSIVTQLASTSGVLQVDAMHRLNRRLETAGSQSASSYECVLLVTAYDLYKRREDEVAARACLKRLTQEDSQDGAIWAAWALMQFLDWTKEGVSPNHPLLESALSAAHRAVQLDPTGSDGHEYLGLILMARGEEDEALRQLLRAQELNPSKPELHVVLGYHWMLHGDWAGGLKSVRLGVALTPSVPGWMRIPLSINAFISGDYTGALSEAEEIIFSGDSRGIVLALAAAIALDDKMLIAKHQRAFLNDKDSNLADPMRAIRNVFNAPEVLQKYEVTLARADLG